MTLDPIDEAFLAWRDLFLAAATRGVWIYDDDAACITSAKGDLIAELAKHRDQDANAIIDAVNSQPALIAEIRRLTIELAACEDVLNGEIRAYAEENKRLRAQLQRTLPLPQQQP